MDGFVGLDPLPSLHRFLSFTNVVGCSLSSSVELPPRRLVPDKHRERGRGSLKLVYLRHDARIMTMGAMGRYSGAIHGSNTRKRSSRRRPSRHDYEDDDQDFSEPESEKETVHGASAEDPENFQNCGYASDDRADAIEVKRSSSQGFDVDVYVYDDIHGDFWPNNPYFQEMEASQVEKYAVQIDDFKNKAITNPEAVVPHAFQDAESVSLVNVTKNKSSESLLMQEDRKGSENLIATSSDYNIRMATAHEFDINNVKDMTESSESNAKKSQNLNSDRGKETFVVRETKSAERPADVLGSLDSLGSTEIEGRKSLGNAERDSGFSSFPYVSPYRRNGAELICDETGPASSDGSGTPENDANDLNGLSLQMKMAFFESPPEHQSVLFHREPPDPLATSEEMNIAFLSVLTASTVNVSAGHRLPEEVNDPVLKLIDRVAAEMQQMESTPTEVVEQACPSKQELDNQASVSTMETVSLFASEVVEQVSEYFSEPIKEHVGQILSDVENIPSQVSQVAEQVVSNVVNQVTEALSDPVEQVSLAAEQIVEQVASNVVEPIANKASEITSFLSFDEESDDSDDEFEAYRSSDDPEFKGIQGLDNFTIIQEGQGILSVLHDFYSYMLKKPLPEFVLGMFSAPILLSVIFTLLYLPEFSGLALDETARQFSVTSGRTVEGQVGLQLSWMTIFQVFMFSVSLSTGLQPELSPLSPYTLVIANLNALIAQLIFVFLSGAVFARLSQPSQPVRCATVALISPPPSVRRIRKETSYKVLMTRYVLVGPQPSELVDVKVDLTYKYNSMTRTGSYLRMTQSLKLVRPEVAYLTHGMLVRHIIDETSPLYCRNHEMLVKEDAIFSLSVVGLERSSMQSVFYVQHYCVHDGDVIWDAEFEDMILINKKNRRVVDHSLLSKWRPL